MNDNQKKFYHSELDVHQRRVFTQYLQLSSFLASEGVIYMADAGKRELSSMCNSTLCQYLLGSKCYTRHTRSPHLLCRLCCTHVE